MEDVVSGYWNTGRGTHEYFADGWEQFNDDMSTFVIDMSEGGDRWHVQFWDRPLAPTRSWIHTISYDVIPQHAVEEARAWAIATWRMTS